MKIQEIWNGNGDQFLRWLSDQANLAILNELVGFSLQLEAYEQDSADGSAYLLCKDRGTNFWVLIEHPVGDTLESQLGRLLLDASRYSPVHALWLTGEFTPALRSVIDWVNTVTDETVNLFGMEVEFWRIGDSAYAPHFNLALQPATWDRSQPAQPDVLAGPPVGSREMTPARPPAGPPAPQALPPLEPAAPEQDGREDRPPSGLFTERAEDERPYREQWEEPLPSPEPPQMSRTPGMREAPPPPNPSPAPPAPPETPSGMLRRAAAEEREEGPSGMLKRWQESDTTVTPSGMLQRLKVQRENSGQPEAVDGGERPLSPAEQLYLDFWTRFWEDIVRWEDEFPPERAMSQGWVTFPIGRESFYLVAFINAEHNLAGMGLVMEGPQSAQHFEELSQDRNQIEREIGAVLDWRRLPDKDESHIYLHKRDVLAADRSRWIEYQQWFAETLETFVEVFGTRVQELPPQNHRSGEPVYRQD